MLLEVWWIIMGQFFNTKVIQNILNVEEKMLDSIRKIAKFQDLSEINYYSDEIERIKLYYKKEKILISKIPDDIDFYDYLFELLKNSSFGLKDENLLVSRFRNILYNNYLTLQPKYEGVNIIGEEDYYDDELYEFKAKLFIRDNLLAEYIRSFDGPMQIADKNSFDIFNRIRLYNIFLNSYLFDCWIKNGFDVDNIRFYTNDESINLLHLSKEDYYYILDETISENCANMLAGAFSDVKKPKTNIIVQDYFFNFKFLLKKLSTESILSIKEELCDVSSNNNSLFSDVMQSLDIELNNRNDVYEEYEEDADYVDSALFDKIVNFVKLENKIYDLYDNIDFNFSNTSYKELNDYIMLEKDMVKDIYVSPSLVTIFNDLFNGNMWIYLTGDTDKKSFVISQRISNLIPFYKDLKISPSQDVNSYKFIYKNHLIRSLTDLWTLKCESKDETIRNGLEYIYKFYYFINPELTDELIALNGNHTLIFDLPSDLSGLDNLEYNYDQDEQLFNLGCEIISYIFDNEDNINSVLDYSEFQFKVNELMDIISNISISYNRKLYKYLMDYSSFFSPLRRDIRKIFKKEFVKSNVKGMNY